MEPMLRGRTALITGASGGIGRAIAREFAAHGASVVVHYRRHADVAEELARELRGRYPEQRFPTARADVTVPDEVDALFRLVAEEFGTLDILVNSAGINRDRSVRRLPDADWAEVMAVNLSGVFYCTSRALELLRRDGGRIISISSIIGFTGNFGQANYAATKSGIIGFTRSLAQELAKDGITVNAIAPGFIDTPMTADMPPKYRALWESRIPLGRFGRPEEVAWAALFLASPRASYVTGAIIHVNGGVAT